MILFALFFLLKNFCKTGNAKVKMSSQPEGGTVNGNDFVERRRAALERYLRRTAQHPVLVLDPDFREFLESGKNLDVLLITFHLHQIF